MTGELHLIWGGEGANERGAILITRYPFGNELTRNELNDKGLSLVSHSVLTLNSTGKLR